eukprot:Clim_evm11s224 gene=Clim_evmTU11s224
MPEEEFTFSFGDDSEDTTVPECGFEPKFKKQKTEPPKPVTALSFKDIKKITEQDIPVEEIRVCETGCHVPFVKPSATSRLANQAFGKHDVVAGVYEGGFKLWESSVDLGKYLCHNSDSAIRTAQRVLEVGCGMALPSVTVRSLQTRAKSAQPATYWLQDYNEEVIRQVTHACLTVNGWYDATHGKQINGESPEPAMANGGFLWGSWEAMVEDMKNSKGDWCTDKFDLILGAEVIYRQENVPALCALIDETLAADGLCLLANKKYYFGVGGGTLGFQEHIQAHCPALEIEDIFEVPDEKTAVPRDIIVIKRCKQVRKG